MTSTGNSAIRDGQGVVKWFDARKGYGFIKGPEDQDIFAHYTVIAGDGFRILKDGWTVTYDAEVTGTGWRATRIVLPPGALTEFPTPKEGAEAADGKSDRPGRRGGAKRDGKKPVGDVVVRPRNRPGAKPGASDAPKATPGDETGKTSES